MSAMTHSRDGGAVTDNGGVVEGQSAARPDQAVGHSFRAARGAAAGIRPAAGRIHAQLDLPRS